MLVSAAILAVVIALRKIPVTLTRQSVIFYLIIAIIGTVIPNSFSYSAALHLPAGIMAITIATVPMMSLLVALLFGLETFSTSRLLGVLLGVGALILIALPEASLPTPGMTAWLLVALVAPLCYAIEGNYIAARAPAQLDAMVTLMCASIAGCILILPILYLTQSWVSLLVPWDVSRWALLGSSLGHVVAYTGYVWLVARTGAVFTSQISYVVTLVGVVSSIALLNEQYSALVWVAVALMLVGVSLVQPAQHRAR